MAGQRSRAAAGALVPAIDTASSTAAIRSLGRRGVTTIAVSEHGAPPGFSSKYCDETIRVPDPTTDLEAYESAFLEHLDREDVRTALPFREPDVYVLARNRDAFAGDVAPPWPPLDVLRRAQDRVELFAAAERAGVAAPRTRTADEWDAWDEPTIVKPRYTVRAPEYAERFQTPRSQTSSTRYIPPDATPSVDDLIAAEGHVPLAQAFVPTTDEYGFFGLYDDGTPVATFQHRQRRGWSYAGGPSAFRESVAIPELEAAGRALLGELDWHGVAMAEFLRDPRTGEFKLMEVNPRFWSSLPFTIQAGVDFPALYWRQASGRPVDAAPAYEVGVAGHLLRGELLHLRSILTDDVALVERPSLARRATEVGVSLFGHPRFDYLDLDDPWPFVRDLGNALGELPDGLRVTVPRRLRAALDARSEG
jgi:predicted ATP-grasp superfamily ATP-dependent carboligase